MLKAPFPWFGGKSRAASLIWTRLGNCANYVEPFAGSLAVLLGRPHAPQVETVNDADCYVSNFWRAVQREPDAVAEWADWPVNEADLHARHVWLVDQTGFRERMLTDPHFFDAQIAGWWVWGISSWIGSRWCDVAGEDERTNERTNERTKQYPSRQLPHLSDAGIGVHRGNYRSSDPIAASIKEASGHGRQRNTRTHARTHARTQDRFQSSRTAGKASTHGPGGFFDDLSARLRNVRICCGDWTRVLGPSVTFRHGITGIVLDPPYASERSSVYSQDSSDVAHAVRAWAIENGDNRVLRIALCGYDGEHEMPASWISVGWKAQGGYGSQGDGLGRENAEKERIWFSPGCQDLPLFADEATA